VPSPSRDEILALDRQHLWHPYTAFDEQAIRPPLVIARADGALLHDLDGRPFLDGNSSWWVAALGHRHPRLVRALAEQAAVLGHTALAGVTHEPAARLAGDLCAIAPQGLTRVLFSDDGSTAVEAALKIALQFFAQNGRPEKRRFLGFDGAFHGDTAGAVSLGGIDVFRRRFGPLLFDALRVPSPAPDDDRDVLGWERACAAVETLLARDGREVAAVVVEPIVQGAAGMRIHAPEFLMRLRQATAAHDVLLIADEVFTGYGRTGPMWACAHAGIAPDLLCTAKAFSGGLLPMAATLATERIFDGFRGGRDRALLHGHSFTGNPLGAAVAREVLAVYRDEDVLGRAARKAPRLAAAVDEVRRLPFVMRVRHIGMIAAADLAAPSPGSSGYLGDAGWRVYDEALRRGALLRPLGDTVYLAPPLTIPDEDLDRLCAIFVASVGVAGGG
jgi:adenosylmethionine---8-amino-7-oxononanoate aminotransferase